MSMGNTVAQIAFRLIGNHLGRFAVAAVFLLSFSSSWAVCTTTAGSNPTCSQDGFSCKCETYPGNAVICGVFYNGSTSPMYALANCSIGNGYYSTGSCEGNVCRCTRCNSQAEIDSVNCVNAGNVWQNGQCQGPIDSSACDSYRQECVSMGGRFVGNPVDISASPTGCLSFCDMCSSESQQRYRRAIGKICCGKGQVPPEYVTSCVNNEAAGSPEMSFSSFDCDNRGGFDCGCEEISSENSSIYQQICIDDDWPESSSGGTPGSSSSEGEGGSSAGPYPEGCDECPWLDSILDTLTLNKWNTDDIVACLTTPGLCAGLTQDTFPVFAFDTAWLKYIRPFYDTTLALDSAQLKALFKLDTNELKKLRLDSAKLENDTATRRVISGGFSTLDSTTDALNDSTRKWFRRIADSIGVSTDSLAAHLDSILEHIPDSILDSIVKYQRYATDNFDSVLFGHGKGFSLVDSFIDSSVKYFKESNQKWNEYISMYGDSTQKIHEEIIDLPGRNASAIGYALGYGDTATSTLRGDLNGIREAIEGVGNGLGGKIADGIDSAWGDGKSPSDTVGDGPFGGYDSESDSIGNAYLRSVGGLLDSAINDTAFDRIFALGGDTVDWDAAARVPSVDSLKARMDSSIVAQRTEIEDSLQAAFDTLKDEFMLLDYDSLILAPLGMRVPNSNTCPDHCFTYTINGSGANAFMAWLGNVHELKFPFCDNLPGFSFNVLQLIRVIGRLFTAMFCIYIGLWFIAGKK